MDKPPLIYLPDVSARKAFIIGLTLYGYHLNNLKGAAAWQWLVSVTSPEGGAYHWITISKGTNEIGLYESDHSYVRARTTPINSVTHFFRYLNQQEPPI